MTYLGYSAYRPTGDPSLRLLAVGFAFVGVLLESLFGLAGLSIIAYSLRVQ